MTNLKWGKCKNVFKLLIKRNIKECYYTHNKNEIQGSSKIRMKAKGTSENWNIKNNFMARYCQNSTFLEGVPLEQHKEFQITLINLEEFTVDSINYLYSKSDFLH